MRKHVANPRPRPFSLVVKNGSKMRVRCDLGNAHALVAHAQSDVIAGWQRQRAVRVEVDAFAAHVDGPADAEWRASRW